MPTHGKTEAAGAILLIQAVMIGLLSLLGGLGLAALGLGLGLQWSQGTVEPMGLAMVAFVALAQGSLMLFGLLAAAFGAFAAVRATSGGDPSLLRGGAGACLAVSLLNGVASLLTLSCCWATFWSLPVVLGVIALALALEAAAEAPLREQW